MTDARALVARELVRLEDIVDLVAYPDDGTVVVHGSRGVVRLHPGERHEVLEGVDPVGVTDPLAFLPYPLEQADPSPSNAGNSYPEPARRLLSFFADADRSPDLVVMHTPSHFFGNEGGHVGEHGSLDVIQSRAPFLLSGAGVPARGAVEGYARLIDVAPTLLHLAGVSVVGVPPLEDASAGVSVATSGVEGVGPRTEVVAPGFEVVAPGGEGAASGVEGVARTDMVDDAPHRFVIGLLWDGAHCSDLLALAAAGELPAVASLLADGTALTGGAVAEFPSVTLCNHTTALTGVGPGRHGILGNVFYDRARRERINANDESTWHRSAEWLRPGVMTVFERLAQARPSSRSLCVNEAVDRGATVSTMQLVRALSGAGPDLASGPEAGTASASGDVAGAGSGSGAGRVAITDYLPSAADSPYLGEPAHLSDRYFGWATQVDDSGLDQMRQAWASADSAPDLTWWSTVVTDAGHHAGGPRSKIARDSLRDADRRLGVFLAHLDTLGVRDQVTFLLTADHGFERTDEAVTGSWSETLADACGRLGVTYRDEGPGFVYLDVD
ncbi:hypothetical protein J2S57_003129 [Kineosporia succinea]|uniref:Type I phosphodiesterase/nucleotide pyrophosphatase n=1 Tax=Kineosporia succinea TaxID=84632 RepID=A0ABT9P3W4_9ACTN|nr:alkaline phosphatase family protein [Kineosporia succinea]MDP9827380.1 hypothetical protein [Kineosporia succinea]